MTHGHPCISAFYGLNFGLISTYISSFIKIGPKMMKLSSEKPIFWPKSVRRDPWSPMHIRLLMDSSLGWYLPTFQVPSKSVEKLRSYRRRKLFFRPKSVRRDPWSPMHIGILMDSSLGWYLATFQVSSKSAEKWPSYRRRKPFFWPKSLKHEGWSPKRNGV